MDSVRDFCEEVRRTFEVGLPNGPSGGRTSKGACLYASIFLQRLLIQFKYCSALVRGGDGLLDGGILGLDGNWHGHYWVEGRTFEGASFIADITADQFGYSKVVVESLQTSKVRYRPGAQGIVQEAAEELASELGCQVVFGSSWYVWRDTSYRRCDGAAASLLHDDAGNAVGRFWYAWPPFVEAGTAAEVMRRRFATVEAAMAYADKAWPISVVDTMSH